MTTEHTSANSEGILQTHLKALPKTRMRPQGPQKKSVPKKVRLSVALSRVGVAPELERLTLITAKCSKQLFFKPKKTETLHNYSFIEKLENQNYLHTECLLAVGFLLQFYRALPNSTKSVNQSTKIYSRYILVAKPCYHILITAITWNVQIKA